MRFVERSLLSHIAMRGGWGATLMSKKAMQKGGSTLLLYNAYRVNSLKKQIELIEMCWGILCLLLKVLLIV